MKIPPGMTEADVLEAIEKAVNALASSFTFGIYDIDDIKQQGRLYALLVLEDEKYDPSRPLPNFLYAHIRNRLINLKRDKLHRNDPPCRQCATGDFCTAEGPCKKFQDWRRRNTAKANLQRPLDLNHLSDDKENRTRIDDSVSEDVALAEMLRMIDEQLPVELRPYYLQMRAGVSIPKAKREQVNSAIKEIVGCQNSNEDD